MSIGETLATARQDAGLTIADIGRVTCIRETIIRAIERDEFELCGGHFYARGHIRSIAQAIGIDAQPLVEQYDAQHGGSPRAATLTRGLDPAPVSISSERRRPNWSMVMAALLLVVVVFGVFQLVDGSRGSGTPGSGKGDRPGPVAEDTESRASSTASRTPSARAQDASSPTPSKTQSTQPPRPNRATIRLEATAPTWISAEGPDGEQLYEGTLQSGDSVRFTDDKLIRLVIGNLGGVSMTINGKDMGVVGEPGAVSEDLRVYPDRVEGIS